MPPLSFDLARAVRAIEPNTPADVLLQIGGVEADVSRMIGERMDPEMKRRSRGFWVPLRALAPARQTRDLTTSTGSGAVAVPRATVDEFTDVLRAKSVLGVLGARFVSLFGGSVPVAIPTKTSGATAGWVAQGEALPSSNLEFDEDANVEPQTVGATITVSRKMWNHAGGEGFQDYLVDELGGALAAEVDRAGLAGAGGVEPVGLFEHPDVPIASIGANGGPLTRALLVGAMKQVHLANGDSPANARMGWATNPDVEAALRLTDGLFGDGALWGDDDRILGKPAAVTTAIPNDLAKGTGEDLSAIAYGNWADVLINHAPAAFVLVNPYSLDTAGSVRVTAYLDVKLVFRHPDSFVVFKDVATT